jgi:hypothetical protein
LRLASLTKLAVCLLALTVSLSRLSAQDSNSSSDPNTAANATNSGSSSDGSSDQGPASDTAQSVASNSADGTSSPASPMERTAASSATAPQPAPKPAPPPQPKRILGVMPNFRAVSAGTIPPPPSVKQNFMMATHNSFDYSAFVFVGITSLLAESTDAHPQLGAGIDGFAKYYWRGYVDKTDGNYWVMFLLPSVLHEDERYYAMGRGGFWKRAVYSSTRILITPSYHGHNTINASELLGRGISQGISLLYYPSQDRTPGAIATKLGYAFGRDALTNVFREFWPDIAVHVLHRHP